jgi:hypothetical protein
MKKIQVLIIILLLFLINTGFSNTLSDPSYYHILNDINTLSSFYPRIENSKGESDTIAFIENRLQAGDIKYKKYDLSKSSVVKSGSVTIDAVIPGKSGNEVFLIFPLNHTKDAPPGRDGGANLAAALALTEELKKKPPPQNVHIVFMGAEFGNYSEYPIGTKDFLFNYYPELNSAFFYFNFKFIPEKILINHSGTGLISPLWILKKSVDALNSAELDFSTASGINLVNRLKLNDKAYLIDSYLENDYSAIYFEGEYSGFYTPEKEQLSIFLSFLLDIVLEGGGLIPSNLQWDSHYLFLKLKNYEIFINETSYVIFLLILLSLIIIYPFIASKRFRKYSKTLILHLWNIPVIFFIMFLLLWISTIIINIILQTQSIPSLWEILPFHFLALKLSISVLIFLLTLRLSKGIHFSRRGSFYSASAMLFIIVDLLVLIFIDITFSYYILPVLIFTFSFTIFKNRWMKLIFLILSILVLSGGITNIFLLDVNNIIRLVLLSPITGNLIITANLIPITLMIFRLQFLFHQNHKRRNRILTIGGDMLLGIISISLFIYLTTFNPFNKERLQPIEITEIISINENNREITFSSPGPLGRFTYRLMSKSGNIDTQDKEYTIPEEISIEVPEITLATKNFLNRTQYLVTADSYSEPEKITAKLTGKETILLFDSNFIHINSDDNTTYFMIETNPQLPLELSFTLSDSFEGELVLEFKFYEYPEMVLLESNEYSTNHTIIFKKRINIRNSD